VVRSLPAILRVSSTVGPAQVNPPTKHRSPDDRDGLLAKPCFARPYDFPIRVQGFAASVKRNHAVRKERRSALFTSRAAAFDGDVLNELENTRSLTQQMARATHPHVELQQQMTLGLMFVSPGVRTADRLFRRRLGVLCNVDAIIRRRQQGFDDVIKHVIDCSSEPRSRQHPHKA
jgi:hypothetical protein